MRYEIAEHGRDVEINVRQTGEHAPELLASLEDCQHHGCGCPSDQYDRLEDMTVHATLDELTIQLHPRAGERLDTGQLQTCLDYTIASANRDRD
jgi:hypothetical protein